MIKLENRAVKGVRLYLHDSILMDYPFQIELQYNYVGKNFMITIYEYDSMNVGYSAHRMSADTKKYHHTSRDSVFECLKYAEEYLSDAYDMKVEFDRDIIKGIEL